MLRGLRMLVPKVGLYVGGAGILAMVILILAFVWLTPPDWIGDPMAHGQGPIGWVIGLVNHP